MARPKPPDEAAYRREPAVFYAPIERLSLENPLGRELEYRGVGRCQQNADPHGNQEEW